MEPNQVVLEAHAIVQAFQVMATANQSRELVNKADQYLGRCEQNNKFSLVLMEIFTSSEDMNMRLQVLVHLKNVIKRNWTSNMRMSKSSSLNEEIKGQVKEQLLLIYRDNWSKYYKEFNEIFKFLSRKDFPAQYVSLHAFLKHVLSTLANLSIDQVLTSQELLPYLSLVKTVLK